MKPGTLTSRLLWLPVLAGTLIVALASWDFDHAPAGYYKQDQNPTDTPKLKTAQPEKEKKVRDLDEVLDEMNAIDMQTEMKKAQEEISKVLKELDTRKIQLDVEKSMKEIDIEKLIRETRESMSKINMDELMTGLNQLDKNQMKEVQQELAKIKPEIDREMAKTRLELENIKPEIEK